MIVRFQDFKCIKCGHKVGVRGNYIPHCHGPMVEMMVKQVPTTMPINERKVAFKPRKPKKRVLVRSMSKRPKSSA